MSEIKVALPSSFYDSIKAEAERQGLELGVYAEYLMVHGFTMRNDRLGELLEHVRTLADVLNVVVRRRVGTGTSTDTPE